MPFSPIPHSQVVHPRRALVMGLGLGLVHPAWAQARSVKFAMTPAFLHDQHALLAQWRAYLEARLGWRVEFLQRDRYRDTIDMLQQRKVEFAWICDYPYVMLRRQVRLAAVALNEGKPTYRSYLIVSSKDGATQSLRDLRGAVFAYADPHSNTGYLVPRYSIHQLGEDPRNYFKRTFFTRSHRKVIEAVATGLAQAGAVDSYVWDVLDRYYPEITRRTRIVWKSPEYGFPPIVAASHVPNEAFTTMQQQILAMPNDPEGRDLLQRLKLDGFIAGSPKLYDGVAEMMQVFGES